MAGLVKRYHEFPVSREQTTAEHSWHLARIYLQIFGLPRAEVLAYIIHHDSGELAVGDNPFPVKRDNPDLKEIMNRLETESLERQGICLPGLSQEEAWRVKLCDLLEMNEFGREDYARGNKFAFPIIEHTWKNICAMLQGDDATMTMVRAHLRRYEGWSET